MKTVRVLPLAVAVSVAMAMAVGPAGATTWEFVDSGQYAPSANGNSITYDLTYNLLDATTLTYSASLAITNAADTTPDWYGISFIFKFDGGPSTISNLGGPDINAADWTIVNGGATDQVRSGSGVPQYTTLQSDGFTGFYATSMGLGGTTDDKTDGILLTGTPDTQTITFNFQLCDPSIPGCTGVINPDGISFQVRFFGPDKTNPTGAIEYDRLSATLVPEPGTLFLLGSGLVAVGIFGRRFRGHH